MLAQACRSCGGPKPAGQGRKLCDDCREEREAEQKRESNRAYYQRHRGRLDAQNRAWATTHPDQRREHQRRYSRSEKRLERDLLTKYGLSLGDYYAMLEAQGGVCAICKGTDAQRRLNIDHDHDTGEVRGLLCSGCNGARLGRFGHDVERMQKRAALLEDSARKVRAAIEYLNDPPARRVI